MPRTGRFKRSQIRHYLKRIFVVAVLATIGAGLYYGVQTEFWKDFVTGLNGKSVNPNRDSHTESPTVAPSDFENFLGKSSIQQLILRSTEMVDDPQETVIARLDRQQKKIQIADVLLGVEYDARANEFGIISMLKALRTRETINFDHGLSTDEGITELQDFAFRNVPSDDLNVKREAQTGKFFSNLARVLTFSSLEDGQSRDALLLEFRSLCKQYNADGEMAATLYSYIERIHVRSTPPSTEDFVETFSTCYKESASDELRKVAQVAAKKILETEFDFVDVFAAISKGIPQAGDLLLHQLDSAVEKPNISQQGYVSIFRQVQNLSRLGRYDDALRLSEILQSRLAVRESMHPLIDAIQEMRRHYKQAGRTFQFDAMKKLDGAEFSVRYPDAAVKAVLFLDSKTRDVAEKAIYFVMNTAGKYVASKDFCMSIIYLDGGDDSSLIEFRRFEKLVKIVDVGIVDTNSETGKAFVQDYSISQLPVLMLLDGDNRIAAVNVQKPDFEWRFKEIIEQ